MGVVGLGPLGHLSYSYSRLHLRLHSCLPWDDRASLHGGRGQSTQTSKATSAAASAAESTAVSAESTTASATESTTGTAESTTASPKPTAESATASVPQRKHSLH